MRPALHRSITFWSGLFVMLSLCWAWRDSTSHLSHFGWKRMSTGSMVGGIVIVAEVGSSSGWRSGRTDLAGDSFWEPGPGPYPMLLRATTKLSYDDYTKARESASTFRERIQAGINLGGPGNWFLYIPYWLILLLFALLWSTLLLARARRRKRIPSATNPDV